MLQDQIGKDIAQNLKDIENVKRNKNDPNYEAELKRLNLLKRNLKYLKNKKDAELIESNETHDSLFQFFIKNFLDIMDRSFKYDIISVPAYIDVITNRNNKLKPAKKKILTN